MVNNKIVTKNSELVEETDIIHVLPGEKMYVGRGGLKLEKALEEFGVNPSGLIALDVGSSTGGFTDCLLRQGAKKVYAVDVGTDQFDSELKKDPRIVLMEKTDIRKIEALPEKPDLAVIDVSFISLEKILEKVSALISAQAKIIALVKPQFETEQKIKNKNGVIKDQEEQKQALEKVKAYSQKIGLKILGETASPILGGSGNKEFLLFLQNNTKMI